MSMRRPIERIEEAIRYKGSNMWTIYEALSNREKLQIAFRRLIFKKEQQIQQRKLIGNVSTLWTKSVLDKKGNSESKHRFTFKSEANLLSKKTNAS